MPEDIRYSVDTEPTAQHTLNEAGIEDLFIQKLRDLKYTDRHPRRLTLRPRCP